MTTAVAELRILIVEDERPLAEAVRRHFVQQGHAVAVAHDAAAALRAHRERPVDVALIDLALDGSDGVTVLKELLFDPQPPECLIVTGRGSIDGAVEAMRIGAFDYVSKPFKFVDLDARVARACARRAERAATRGDVTALGDLEKRHIASVLNRTNWHQGHAARLLGISVRTLYRKIREFGFNRPGAQARQ